MRCQRCGRPACPECQRTAAVGVHCVDCVREANRAAPAVRSVFGAPLRSGPPVVTVTLIALCVVSFVLQEVMGRLASPGAYGWTELLAFHPWLAESEPWRFVTSAFVHAGLWHVGLNMLALWVMGQSLEGPFGRARFLALFLVSAAGGAVMALYLTPGPSWLVGASGGVFGLFGAMLPALRRLRRSVRPVMGILVVNALLGFVIPNVSWQGHLGGLLTGAALGAAYAYAPRRRRGPISVVATVAVVVLLAAAAAAWYA